MAKAVTVTLWPTSGREAAAPPTVVVTDAIEGGCEPQGPTVSASLAGRLLRPLAAVATSCTVYVPGAPPKKSVAAPVADASVAPEGETLHE